MSDYMDEYTPICKICGERTHQIYDGYCLDCLIDNIDYDTFFEYMENRKCFVLFMFEAYFGCPEPKEVSSKLIDTLEELYKRQVADDKIRGKHDFMDLIKKFILEDDGEFGREDYGEFLTVKGVKN